MENWTVVTSDRDPKFWVRGTELDRVIYGPLARFEISSIRTFERTDTGNEYDRRYVIRDAQTVSDADVKAGKRPAIVGQFPSLEAAQKAIDDYWIGHPIWSEAE